MATTQPGLLCCTAAVCLARLPMLLSNTGAAVTASATAFCKCGSRAAAPARADGADGHVPGLQQSSLLRKSEVRTCTSFSAWMLALRVPPSANRAASPTQSPGARWATTLQPAGMPRASRAHDAIQAHCSTPPSSLSCRCSTSILLLRLQQQVHALADHSKSLNTIPACQILCAFLQSFCRIHILRPADHLPSLSFYSGLQEQHQRGFAADGPLLMGRHRLQTLISLQ